MSPSLVSVFAASLSEYNFSRVAVVKPSKMAKKKPHMSGRGADETSRPAASFLSQCDLNHIISKLGDCRSEAV